MGRFSVAVRLSSCAFLFALGLTADALAGHDHCKEIDEPTTIDHDKKCVRVVEEVDGDIVNNATVGDADRDRPGFFIGGDGSITGRLVNTGTITGGGPGLGALTLGKNADVEGGIFNTGTIVSTHGNGINLGYREYTHHGWRTRAAALSGDIVNSGAIEGHAYGIAALYGTMSGAFTNEAGGTIEGGEVALFIADTFAIWTGGIENHGLIEGGHGGIVVAGASFAGAAALAWAGMRLGRVIPLPASLETGKTIPYGVVIAAAALSVGPGVTGGA